MPPSPALRLRTGGEERESELIRGANAPHGLEGAELGKGEERSETIRRSASAPHWRGRRDLKKFAAALARRIGEGERRGEERVGEGEGEEIWKNSPRRWRAASERERRELGREREIEI